MYDVYFYEAFAEEADLLKYYLSEDISAGFTWQTIQEAGEEIPPARLISIRTQSILPANWSESLSGILSRSTGYDHIKRYLRQTGSAARCGYLPLYCNRAVAEQAMLLWMTLLRKLPLQLKKFSNFNRDGLTGFECRRKTLVVVGVGNIGSEVVKIGQGLEMDVYGVDIVEKYNFVKYASIEEVFSSADIIVCSMNLTEQNTGYFSYDLLKKARPGVIFVNIARGEMSPSGDLLRLLNEGHLGGVALDVFNHESELAVALRTSEISSNPEVKAILDLSGKDNVILTPHNAFNTAESVDRKASQSIEQIRSFLEKGHFLWSVPV